MSTSPTAGVEFLEPAPPSTARWWHPSTWTLRSKLVASMLLLFTVMTLVIGAASVLSLDRTLTTQLDDQLRSSLGRIPPQLGGTASTTGTPRDTDGDFARGPGDEGFVVVVANGTPYARPRDTITVAQIQMLQDAGLGTQPKNVDLGGDLGEYRVLAGTSARASGAIVYVGLPRARQAGTVGNAFRTALLASVLGLLAVGIGGAWLVKRNLRPLTRVADTATRVSQLHLASGQVALAERVPEQDTDPRTEVGRVGQALNELLDHVDAALNARHESEQRVRQFVADASHELRTPLASIRGYAELTRKEPEPVPAGVVHAISRVESEATRMSSLVDDLLLLARLDAGRPLDQEDVDLTEIVVNAVSDAHAASPQHKWRLDVPDEPVLVRGDGARLHQIVANLLGNARVHTLPGTTVLASISREPGIVRLSVRARSPASQGLPTLRPRRLGPFPHRWQHRPGSVHRGCRRRSPRRVRAVDQQAGRHHFLRPAPRSRRRILDPPLGRPRHALTTTLTDQTWDMHR
jgi:two-component system OmpR family sensor kinase